MIVFVEATSILILANLFQSGALGTFYGFMMVFVAVMFNVMSMEGDFND